MAKKRSNEEIEADLLLEHLKDVMSTVAGKEVLYHILGTCGVYNQNFCVDNNAFFLDGKRSVGLELIDLIMESNITAYSELLLYKAKQEEGKNNE